MKSSKEYFLKLSEECILYVDFSTKKGQVTEFVVKLLMISGNKWYEVIRYDSGHNCPHKDILDIDGSVIRKIWFDFLDNSQALTVAITDIKDNFEIYKERFMKWLKKQ